jgi:hypothetical protein
MEADLLALLTYSQWNVANVYVMPLPRKRIRVNTEEPWNSENSVINILTEIKF